MESLLVDGHALQGLIHAQDEQERPEDDSRHAPERAVVLERECGADDHEQAESGEEAHGEGAGPLELQLRPAQHIDVEIRRG